jgi:hypothetical protein
VALWGASETKQKNKTAKDFSLWLDITGLMLSSTLTAGS